MIIIAVRGIQNACQNTLKCKDRVVSEGVSLSSCEDTQCHCLCFRLISNSGMFPCSLRSCRLLRQYDLPTSPRVCPRLKQSGLVNTCINSFKDHQARVMDITANERIDIAEEG